MVHFQTARKLLEYLYFLEHAHMFTDKQIRAMIGVNTTRGLPTILRRERKLIKTFKQIRKEKRDWVFAIMYMLGMGRRAMKILRMGGGSPRKKFEEVFARLNKRVGIKRNIPVKYLLFPRTDRWLHRREKTILENIEDERLRKNVKEAIKYSIAHDDFGAIFRDFPTKELKVI